MTNANQQGSGLPPPSTKERLINLLRKHKVGDRWQTWYPLIGGAVAAALVFRVPIDDQVYDKLLNGVLPAAISVAAIFAGFQGAIHAILLSMLKSRVIKRLRELKMYDRLIDYIRSGIMSLTFFVAVALLVIFLSNLGISPSQHRAMTSLLMGLFSFSMIASTRIMLLEVAMLRVPDDT